MNRFLFTCLFCVILSIESAWAYEPDDHANATVQADKVTLQLKWFNQFQFAGYYAALEQNYYADEGLDVEIRERDIEKDFVTQVISGEAEYGVGDSGLISQFAQGKPITALAAIFQHSPLVFFSTQHSGIISPYEMTGKRIMSDMISINEALIRAMLVGVNITEKDYSVIPLTNDYDLLQQGDVDVISGYLTDQPFSYKEKGIDINIINPQHYGIDFYGDILFTSQKEIRDHPKRAEGFRRASIKGWQYALAHPEEMIEIISTKYHSKLSIEHLRFEAAAIKKLILPDIIPLGKIMPKRLKVIADTYAVSGFNRALSDDELSEFIYNKQSTALILSDDEQAWLDTHPIINIGIDRDFAPYEWIDEEGHYVGMAADYMRLLENKLGVRFNIIKDKSWAEILEMAERDELDILSCAVKTPERSRYLTFTDSYKAAYAVIIDNGTGHFIGDLAALSGKIVAIEKGYFMQELLEKNHPKIQLKLASDTQAALTMVANDEVDAYVGDAGSANYAIKKSGLLSLRFSGQTNYSSKHGVAITKSNPELTSIIKKAIASIDTEDADKLYNRWMGLRVEQGIQPETLIKYVVGFVLLLAVFSYFIYRMRREISIRKQAEQALLESGNYLRTIIETEPECIKLVSAQGQLLQMNPAGLKMIEADQAEHVYGQKVSELVAPEYRKAFIDMHNKVISGETQTLQFEVIGLKGTRRWMETHAVPMYEPNGTVLHLAVTRDITKRKATDIKLRMLSTAMEQGPTSIVITNLDADIEYVNSRFTEVTGYTQAEVSGQNPRILQSGLTDESLYPNMWDTLNNGQSWVGEFTNKRKNGEIYYEEAHISPVKGPDDLVSHYVAVKLDITDRKNMEEKIRQLAFYDELTALPNRRLLNDRLNQVMSASNRSSNYGSLMFLDLDNFKPINDTHGHSVGDLLLVEVARRLRDSMRDMDTVARFGGDEFVVLLAELGVDKVAATSQAKTVAEKICEVLSEPYVLTVSNDDDIVQTVEHRCTVSIGVTLFINHDVKQDDILMQADTAMYEAKDKGRNRICFYN